MWIFLPYGFLSIVHKAQDEDDDYLTVRARNRKTLVRFCERADVDTELNPIIGQEAWPSDYPYRVRVHRKVVSDWVVREIEDLTWSNFKNEAKRVGGAVYENVLHKVWSSCLQLTPQQVQTEQRKAWKRYDAWWDARKQERDDCNHRHTAVDQQGQRYCTDCGDDV